MVMDIGARKTTQSTKKINAEIRKSTIFDKTEAYGTTSRGKATFFNSEELSTRLIVADIIEVWNSVHGSRAA